MRVSVVIPAFNEAGNIANLVRETYESLDPDILAEVIVVDDFSADGTGEELRAIAAEFPTLRVIRHAETSGQSAALRTGITAASTNIIASMDGDGQNDPSDLSRLLERLGEPGGDGPALVNGVRAKRIGTASIRWASRIANTIRDAVLRDDCPDTGCGIKVYWRDAFLRLPFFTSIHRYLPALFQSYGLKVDYVPVNDRPRLAGISKYSNFGRAMLGLYDLVGVSWLRRRTIVPGIEADSAKSE